MRRLDHGHGHHHPGLQIFHDPTALNSLRSGFYKIKTAKNMRKMCRIVKPALEVSQLRVTLSWVRNQLSLVAREALINA